MSINTQDFPMTGCPLCGIVGIHACIGKPMEPWTKEEESELNIALAQVFNMEKDIFTETFSAPVSFTITDTYAYTLSIMGRNHKEVGKFYWGDGTLRFTGKTDESAEVFVNFLLQSFSEIIEKEKQLAVEEYRQKTIGK